MPPQFQLRDIVIDGIIGSTILLLFVVLLLLFYPPRGTEIATHFQSIKGQVGDAVLVPMLLVVVYVVGATMPSTRSLHPLGEPKHALYRVLRVFRVAPKMDFAPSDGGVIRDLYLKKGEKEFGIDKEKSDAESETLFVLAQTAVLKENASMQQADIERHFVLMHFNSKLCMLFFAACLLTLVGVGWSLLSVMTPVCWWGIRLRFLVPTAILFWMIARASGTNAKNNRDHWRNSIIRSFVVSSG
jgi:hypothetical protein